MVGAIPHTIRATGKAAQEGAQAGRLAPLGKKSVTPFSAKPARGKIQVINEHELGPADVQHLLKNQGKMKNASISVDALFDELAKIGW